MRKMLKHRILLLTVVIALVVITAAFVTMMTGREMIIESQKYAAEKRAEKLANELLDEYDSSSGCDAHVMRVFNEKNQTSIICVLDNDSDEIIELHINFMQFNLYEPISSMIPEISRIFEMDTEDFVADYCNDHDMDHQTTTISEMRADELFDMIEELREKTGVQL